MPKEDKYYRALSALNDDDRTFLYKLIPNLSEQTEDIQTKVEELAEIVINRTSLSLPKIIEYQSTSYIRQGLIEPKTNQYSRYYKKGYFNSITEWLPSSNLIYRIKGMEQKGIEKDKEIKKNYVNKIEQKKDHPHPVNILDNLKGTSNHTFFSKAIYQGINSLVNNDIYGIIENRAIIVTLLEDSITNDAFCNFKDFKVIIKTALDCDRTIKKHKKKSGASKYLNQLTDAMKNGAYKNPNRSVIKYGRYSTQAYRVLEEWQILYTFFKPIKEKIINTANEYNEWCNEQYIWVDLSDWLDVVIYAVYGYYKESKFEEQYFNKLDDLISAYKKLYMDNQKKFCFSFYSLNHFVQSFNVVALCLYEYVWDKDIEPFFN